LFTNHWDSSVSGGDGQWPGQDMEVQSHHVSITDIWERSWLRFALATRPSCSWKYMDEAALISLRSTMVQIILVNFIISMLQLRPNMSRLGLLAVGG
jgi:hypothetical protein